MGMERGKRGVESKHEGDERRNGRTRSYAGARNPLNFSIPPHGKRLLKARACARRPCVTCCDLLPCMPDERRDAPALLVHLQQKTEVRSAQRPAHDVACEGR